MTRRVKKFLSFFGFDQPKAYKTERVGNYLHKEAEYLVTSAVSTKQTFSVNSIHSSGGKRQGIDDTMMHALLIKPRNHSPVLISLLSMQD
jgi:hypothetical protein